MQFLTRATLFGLASYCFISLITPEQAQAGGFLIPKMGGDTAGAATPSPSAIFWNPAAISLLPETQLFLDANLILRDSSFNRIVDRGRPGGTSLGTSTLSSADTQPMLAVTSDLGQEKWTFGLGIYSPFGSTSTWDDPNGPQRYQAIFGRILSVFVSPTVAWEPTPGLHLGLSVSYVHASVQTYRALDFGPLVGGVTGSNVPSEEPGNEGRALLDFSGSTFAYTLGVAYNTQRSLWGLSFSSPVNIDIDGNLQVFVPRSEFYQNLTGGDLNEPATLMMNWPGAVRAGVSWMWDDNWTLALNLDWTLWSSYDKTLVDVANNDVAGLGNFDQTLVTNYQDTYGARIGLRRRLNPEWEIFAGFGGETGAIPDRFLDPSLFDSLKLGFAVGATWAFTRHISLTASYNRLYYQPTFISDTEVEPPPTGLYTQSVSIFNTNLTWTLPDLLTPSSGPDVREGDWFRDQDGRYRQY